MSFLGMFGFYRKFCPNYCVVAEPMIGKMSSVYDWKCPKSFEGLKALLANSSVNVAPEFSQQSTVAVYVDASHVGVGYVLIQDHDKT